MAEKLNEHQETYRSFGERITAVESAVGGLKEDMQTIAKSVKEVVDKIDQVNRPAWGPIFTFIGLLITIIFFFTQSYQGSMEDLHKRDSDNAANIEVLNIKLAKKEAIEEKELQDRLIEAISNKGVIK
jgi:hypothetical protein